MALHKHRRRAGGFLSGLLRVKKAIEEGDAAAGNTVIGKQDPVTKGSPRKRKRRKARKSRFGKFRRSKGKDKGK